MENMNSIINIWAMNIEESNPVGDIHFQILEDSTKGEVTVRIYGHLYYPYTSDIAVKMATLSVSNPKQPVELDFRSREDGGLQYSSAMHKIQLNLLPMSPDNVLLVEAVVDSTLTLNPLGTVFAKAYAQCIVGYKNE